MLAAGVLILLHASIAGCVGAAGPVRPLQPLAPPDGASHTAAGPAGEDPRCPGGGGANVRYADDIADLRSTTADLADQLRAFNDLYVGKLDSRIMTAATSLSGLHSNVERILERAHVWDTLQLHVAAWSEQMHTLSSKMDLLGRAQENLSALESRLAALPALDYRLEAVAARLEDTEKRLEMLTRNVDEVRLDVRRLDPGLAAAPQFVTRGVLASLRAVERKVDRLAQQVAKQHAERSEAQVWGRAGGGRGGGAADGQQGPQLQLEGGGRLVVRCHAAPDELDMLKDISAKVDVLFDQSPLGQPEDEDDAAVEGDGDAAEEVEAVPALEGRAPRHRQASCPCTPRKRARGRRGRRPGGNHTLGAEGSWNGTTTAPPPATSTQSWTTLPAEDEFSSVSFLETVPPTAAPVPASTAQPHRAPGAATPDLGRVCGARVVAALSALTRAITTVSALPRPGAPRPANDTLAVDADAVGDFKGGSGEYVLNGRRVYLDMDTDGGGWTVVHRRGDWGEPRLNFSRSWSEYRDGFGDPSREYWIGNKWLHTLTAARPLALRVDLWDWDGEHAVAEYAAFRVADEADLFRLSVANYSGNATDALAAHSGMPFSTWDANHDTAPACCPCAPAYSAGWWFHSCFEANLNGEFHTHPEENEYYRGIIWEGWRGDYSLRAASMMVRDPASGATTAPPT